MLSGRSAPHRRRRFRTVDTHGRRRRRTRAGVSWRVGAGGHKLVVMLLPRAVMDDFSAYLNDAIGALVYGRAGLRAQREHWAKTYEEAMVKDKLVVHGVSNPGEEPDRVQVWRLEELQRHLAPDGPVAQFMSDQWVSSVYQQWDEVLRPQAATLLGLSKDEVKIPILGDLRRLRNDVVHHRGVASTGNTGRCEIVASWFAVGDRIMFGPRKAYDFGELLCESQDGYQMPHLSSAWLETCYQDEQRRLREAIRSQSRSGS